MRCATLAARPSPIVYGADPSRAARSAQRTHTGTTAGCARALMSNISARRLACSISRASHFAAEETRVRYESSAECGSGRIKLLLIDMFERASRRAANIKDRRRSRQVQTVNMVNLSFLALRKAALSRCAPQGFLMRARNSPRPWAVQPQVMWLPLSGRGTPKLHCTKTVPVAEKVEGAHIVNFRLGLL